MRGRGRTPSPRRREATKGLARGPSPRTGVAAAGAGEPHSQPAARRSGPPPQATQRGGPEGARLVRIRRCHPGRVPGLSHRRHPAAASQAGAVARLLPLLALGRQPRCCPRCLPHRRRRTAGRAAYSQRARPLQWAEEWMEAAEAARLLPQRRRARVQSPPWTLRWHAAAPLAVPRALHAHAPPATAPLSQRRLQPYPAPQQRRQRRRATLPLPGPWQPSLLRRGYLLLHAPAPPGGSALLRLQRQPGPPRVAAPPWRPLRPGLLCASARLWRLQLPQLPSDALPRQLQPPLPQAAASLPRLLPPPLPQAAASLPRLQQLPPLQAAVAPPLQLPWPPPQPLPPLPPCVGAATRPSQPPRPLPRCPWVAAGIAQQQLWSVHRHPLPLPLRLLRRTRGRPSGSPQPRPSGTRRPSRRAAPRWRMPWTRTPRRGSPRPRTRTGTRPGERREGGGARLTGLMQHSTSDASLRANLSCREAAAAAATSYAAGTAPLRLQRPLCAAAAEAPRLERRRQPDWRRRRAVPEEGSVLRTHGRCEGCPARLCKRRVDERRAALCGSQGGRGEGRSSISSGLWRRCRCLCRAAAAAAALARSVRVPPAALRRGCGPGDEALCHACAVAVAAEAAVGELLAQALEGELLDGLELVIRG